MKVTTGEKFQVEEIPSEHTEKAEEYREKLIEQVVEIDEAAMESYLDGNLPDTAKIKALIRQGTIAGEFVPILCGTAFKNKGVQPLLDAVVDYLPSPIDVPAIAGIDPKTDEDTTRKSDDSEPLSLLAFKIMNDKFVGTLNVLPNLLWHLTKGFDPS